MPVYTIENLTTGKRADIVRSVERRDCNIPEGWKRVFVPTRGFVAGVVDPGSPDGTIAKALRDIELQGQSVNAIERQTGFSRDKLREVWPS